MIWILFIEWQEYWKCHWTMNICANRNTHGKRTVSTEQPQVTDLCGGVGCGVLSSNAFTIWYCIPISRPPRVFRRFKRRSVISYCVLLNSMCNLRYFLFIYIILFQQSYFYLCECIIFYCRNCTCQKWRNKAVQSINHVDRSLYSSACYKKHWNL